MLSDFHSLLYSSLIQNWNYLMSWLSDKFLKDELVLWSCQEWSLYKFYCGKLSMSTKLQCYLGQRQESLILVVTVNKIVYHHCGHLVKLIT